jgi:hypothetical protein
MRRSIDCKAASLRERPLQIRNVTRREPTRLAEFQKFGAGHVALDDIAAMARQHLVVRVPHPAAREWRVMVLGGCVALETIARHLVDCADYRHAFAIDASTAERLKKQSYLHEAPREAQATARRCGLGG